MPQLLGFVQEGENYSADRHANQVSLNFQPDADGLTFHSRRPFFGSWLEGGSKNPARWTGRPAVHRSVTRRAAGR